MHADDLRHHIEGNWSFYSFNNMQPATDHCLSYLALLKTLLGLKGTDDYLIYLCTILESSKESSLGRIRVPRVKDMEWMRITEKFFRKLYVQGQNINGKLFKSK
jgi:hypothetical protein